jgi:3-oxoadipate enol-lactonase
MESNAKTEEELFIEVNGTRMCYTDSLHGEMTVIFVHGFPFDKSMWQPQVRTLKKDYRVITYDIRGFGRSEIGNLPADIDLFARDLLEFINALDIKDVVICGHSIGGYILMTAVNLNLKKIKGLILCDTQCIADSEEMKRSMLELIPGIEKNGPETFVDNIIDNAFSKATPARNDDIITRAKQTAHTTSVKTLTHSLTALSLRHETCNGLKTLTVPVLVLCGKEDNIMPVSRSEFIFNALKNAQLKVIENAGYLPNLEQPEVFNGHILSFLQGLKLTFVKN